MYNYDTFLTALGELYVKLCAQEAMLNDELCEAFSGRISSDVVCASRARWKVGAFSSGWGVDGNGRVLRGVSICHCTKE